MNTHNLCWLKGFFWGFRWLVNFKFQFAKALTYADDTSTSVSADPIKEITRMLEIDASIMHQLWSPAFASPYNMQFSNFSYFLFPIFNTIVDIKAQVLKIIVN